MDGTTPSIVTTLTLNINGNLLGGSKRAKDVTH